MQRQVQRKSSLVRSNATIYQSAQCSRDMYALVINARFTRHSEQLQSLPCQRVLSYQLRIYGSLPHPLSEYFQLHRFTNDLTALHTHAGRHTHTHTQPNSFLSAASRMSQICIKTAKKALPQLLIIYKMQTNVVNVNKKLQKLFINGKASFSEKLSEMYKKATLYLQIMLYRFVDISFRFHICTFIKVFC